MSFASAFSIIKICILFFLPFILHADEKTEINDYLLPKNHSLNNELKSLFKSSSLFHSPFTLKHAGFQVYERIHNHLMVVRHPLISNYLFKKYQNCIPEKVQLKQYLARLRGAKIIQEYIDKHKLKHIVVPKKWLHIIHDKWLCKINAELQMKSYLLIAEDMDICEGGDDPLGENVKQYKKMTPEILYELCQIMHAIGGCDAFPRNQSFTKTGKIAFVDTERVGYKKDQILRRIFPILSKEMQSYGKQIWEQLEKKSLKNKGGLL